MTNCITAKNINHSQLTETQVLELLNKVREFQEINQKYLIVSPMMNEKPESSFINMINTKP